MARSKVAYRKRRQNRFSMFLVILIVILIMVVVAIHSISIRQKIELRDSQISELSAQIEDEEERAQEIEEYGIYTKTKAFIVEMAQDKLGLVFDGEILFKEGQ